MTSHHDDPVSGGHHNASTLRKTVTISRQCNNAQKGQQEFVPLDEHQNLQTHHRKVTSNNSSATIQMQIQ